MAAKPTCMDGIGDKFVAKGTHLHQQRQPVRVVVVVGVDACGVPAPTPGLAGEAPPPPLSPVADMEERLFLLWYPWRRDHTWIPGDTRTWSPTVEGNGEQIRCGSVLPSVLVTGNSDLQAMAPEQNRDTISWTTVLHSKKKEIQYVKRCL